MLEESFAAIAVTGRNVSLMWVDVEMDLHLKDGSVLLRGMQGKDCHLIVDAPLYTRTHILLALFFVVIALNFHLRFGDYVGRNVRIPKHIGKSRFVGTQCT